MGSLKDMLFPSGIRETIEKYKSEGDISLLLNMQTSAHPLSRFYRTYGLTMFDEFSCFQYSGAMILQEFYPGIVKYLEYEHLDVNHPGFFIDVINELLFRGLKPFKKSYNDLIGRSEKEPIEEKDIPAIAIAIEQKLEDGFLYVVGGMHGEHYVPCEEDGKLHVLREKYTATTKKYWEFGKVDEWLKKVSYPGTNSEILQCDLTSPFFMDRMTELYGKREFDSMFEHQKFKDILGFRIDFRSLVQNVKEKYLKNKVSSVTECCMDF